MRITESQPCLTIKSCFSARSRSGGALVLALALLRKIPFCRNTVIGVVGISLMLCVIFYFVNVEISKCIAFYGGWDCGMVANSARWVYEGGDMGYEDYYTVYTNNVPITWLLYKLYSVSASASWYPYNPEFIWIQYQCVMFSVAVFAAVAFVLATFRRIAPAGLTLLIGCVVLGLSPWKVIPYTDASTVAWPILVLCLYALYRNMENAARYLLWLAMVIIGCFGGTMKAPCYVALIAVVLTEGFWLLPERISLRKKAIRLGICAGLVLGGFLLNSLFKNQMYETLHYEYDYDTAMTWTTCFYVGLNEDTTGASSADGLELVRSYEGQPRSVRDEAERALIWERLEEKGLKGLLDFWLRKQVMNFNDGTFSWYQEGFFNAWEYSDLTDSTWKEPLRSFYWEDGENYLEFTTWSQGIWIFILIGIFMEMGAILIYAVQCVFGRHGEDAVWQRQFGIRVAAMVYFLGLFLFVMLFEGRARYLFNGIAALAAIAAFGYTDAQMLLAAILRKLLDIAKERHSVRS